MVAVKASCKWSECGRLFDVDPAKRGHPQWYCSSACRRAKEDRVRALQREANREERIILKFDRDPERQGEMLSRRMRIIELFGEIRRLGSVPKIPERLQRRNRAELSV